MTDIESKATIQKVIADVCKIVSDMSGIQLGEKQVSMVESRLKTRMGRLNITRFDEYLKHLNGNITSESQVLLSLMTTHHTFFFREFSHFEYLANQGLAALVRRARARGDKKIRVWSAACSRGQEVYSLAMFLNYHLNLIAKDIQFEILGTDIDPESVGIAKNGVYRAEELKTVPAMYMGTNWIKGKDSAEGFYKAGDLLRKNLSFDTVNLQSAAGFVSNKKFDLVFCRNVFIYFNQEQIKIITSTLLSGLDPEGLLILGVSETLSGLKMPVELVGPSIYSLPRKKIAEEAVAVSAVVKVQEKKSIRLLCIDDSPTIQALLGKIFTKETDFEIGGRAKNGKEAIEILKNQKFDAITLDLHMPEMDGITFLEQYTDRSAPIMVLSSINRDDISLGQKALTLGAFDYVEKPTLANLTYASDEIRSKLKTGLMAKVHSAKVTVEQKTSVSTPKASSKIRVLIVDDSKTIRTLLVGILSADPDFEVVGQAEDPLLVEGLIRDLKPDLMTLDIYMPKMDGVTLFKSLPPACRIPTVLISSISKEEGPQVFEALEHGAVDYIQKPQRSDLLELGPVIRERLKAAARAKVGKRHVSRKVLSRSGEIDRDALVVIGASTGGTEALRVVLESLPSQVPPILIVQHIPAIFSKAFADRLNQSSPFEIKEAVDGDEVRPNRVLIAPGGTQMAFDATGGRWTVKVNNDTPMNRHKPSVDYLFQSVVSSGHKNVIAAILTGMGADGAAQLLALRKNGARTIAQDEDSCIVFGMPKAAIERGAAEFVLPLEQIAAQIDSLVKKQIRKVA